jgi:uncharacterized protein YaaN involved in tellurite resistance
MKTGNDMPNKDSVTVSDKISAEEANVAGKVLNTAASVPEIDSELVDYANASEKEKAKIDALMEEIRIDDSNSIIFFGTKAQEQLTDISDQILEDVRNKDLGAAGGILNEMVATLRGFDVDELDPSRKQGFITRLFGGTRPLVRMLQQYEAVQRQIDGITDKLETHKTRLLTDITTLDRLYKATLEYFHDLESYITAGEEKLRQIDNEAIPALAQDTVDNDGVLKAQELRDLRARRDDLERRIHDLHLTRQVAMQSLPSIRLVQENDKGLVTKINSTMANTIPLWRQQLATAVTVFRSSEAAKSVKAATDLTNDLLESNAENLKIANAETRRQMERGVFDVVSVKRANQMLIETIEESLQIADEGKRMRADALEQIKVMETELKSTLKSASAEARKK